MRIAAVLVAAGSGTRFGGSIPKQFLDVAGQPVVRHAAMALGKHATFLQPVGDVAALDTALAGIAHLPVVPGGATRQASVRAGLEALAAHTPDIVLIHDAARPYLPATLIPDLLEALCTATGAIPALPVADTLKRAGDGWIKATIPRDHLFRAQTPQAFHFQPILHAHQTAQHEVTDDAALLEGTEHRIALVPGCEDNLKITHPQDLQRMQQHFAPRTMTPRIGTGFDVHRLVAGRPLILCGVQVPHALGLAGHSDADVGIHALCDAIYGALAEGDIGRHFPPSQNTWKDADSARFLQHAAERIAAHGGMLANADVTLICEQPKIGPHADVMRARLAGLLSVPVDRISVKATTSEKLGFTGRGEGIAAQAAVCVLLPV